MKIVDLVETEPSWDALAQEAAARMDGYTLVPWVDVVPEELMDGYCHLNEAFNDEAPSGELELEAEVWDADRVRGDEAQRRRAGRHVSPSPRSRRTAPWPGSPRRSSTTTRPSAASRAGRWCCPRTAATRSGWR